MLLSRERSVTMLCFVLFVMSVGEATISRIHNYIDPVTDLYVASNVFLCLLHLVEK